MHVDYKMYYYVGVVFQALLSLSKRRKAELFAPADQRLDLADPVVVALYFFLSKSVLGLELSVLAFFLLFFAHFLQPHFVRGLDAGHSCAFEILR
jgi:hypothetical protein